MDLKQLLSSCANDARNEEDAMIIMQSVRRIAELESGNDKMQRRILELSDNEAVTSANSNEAKAKIADIEKSRDEYKSQLFIAIRGDNVQRRIAELESQLAAAQERERWIPVAESLPGGEEEVIFQTADKEYGPAIYIGNITSYGWKDDSGMIHDNVVAWRELPAPFKEVADETE